MIFDFWIRSGNIVKLIFLLIKIISLIVTKIFSFVFESVNSYGRNQEMLRFGQIYARLNKMVKMNSLLVSSKNINENFEQNDFHRNHD